MLLTLTPFVAHLMLAVIGIRFLRRKNAPPVSEVRTWIQESLGQCSAGVMPSNPPLSAPASWTTLWNMLAQAGAPKIPLLLHWRDQFMTLDSVKIQTSQRLRSFRAQAVLTPVVGCLVSIALWFIFPELVASLFSEGTIWLFLAATAWVTSIVVSRWLITITQKQIDPWLTAQEWLGGVQATILGGLALRSGLLLASEFRPAASTALDSVRSFESSMLQLVDSGSSLQAFFPQAQNQLNHQTQSALDKALARLEQLSFLPLFIGGLGGLGSLLMGIVAAFMTTMGD